MGNSKIFKRIVIAAHPTMPAAMKEAERIAQYLNEHDVDPNYGFLNSDEVIGLVDAKKVDLMIVLGGDGTVLRAGHLCAPKDIPILGINLGRFGFLSELDRDGWQEKLAALFTDDHWFEQRMMLRAQHFRGDEPLDTWHVLNETMIGRGEIVRPVQLTVELDGRHLTTYVADGLLISTPTGSTAYALAAGGPILPPELRNILIVPVAPHLSVDRAIVLAEGATVSVSVQSDHQAVISLDGKPPVHLLDGDRVEVTASEFNVRFVRFQDPGYFYRHLISLMENNPAAGA